MKEYIKVSIDINGMRGSLMLYKRELLIEFKAAQFYSNVRNPDYWLTIREFIRWQIIKDVYEGRTFAELKKTNL
tara:strand:- start:10 stop:231 length:222 start_codon:yes stop_codon:yes gene_type:complete